MNHQCLMILTMDLNKSSKLWNRSFTEKRVKKKLMPWKWLCSVKVHKAFLYVTLNQKGHRNSQIRQIRSRKRNSVLTLRVQKHYRQIKDISINELEVFLQLCHNKFRNLSSKRRSTNQLKIREITLCKIGSKRIINQFLILRAFIHHDWTKL